jgi:predicted transcriptional regulator
MRGLGELEEAAMELLWHSDEPIEVRDGLERLDTGKELAYTTVTTILDNLHHKAWGKRKRAGEAGP